MKTCEECGKEFGNNTYLTRHTKRVHNPNYIPPQPKECSYCGGMYSNLPQHIKFTHPQSDKDILAVAKIRRFQKEYYKRNSFVINERSKLWEKENIERSRELKRKWANKNKSPLTESNKERIECDKCGKIIIRFNLVRHLKGNHCIQQVKTIIPIESHKLEIDKLKLKIETAKNNNTIQQNLHIQENVILHF
tara:strand:- start:163 stop:738 length:576 start_codon:yes stop_codon:yes gene_type:complete